MVVCLAKGLAALWWRCDRFRVCGVDVDGLGFVNFVMTWGRLDGRRLSRPVEC